MKILNNRQLLDGVRAVGRAKESGLIDRSQAAMLCDRAIANAVAPTIEKLVGRYVIRAAQSGLANKDGRCQQRKRAGGRPYDFKKKNRSQQPKQVPPASGQ